MGVRVCVGACACACAARGTPCVHARTHVHTRRSPLRRGARTGPPPTHRSDKTETIPHTHKSCARRPLRHTQLNSPRHAECVQCDFAAKSPPIRFSTLLVVSAQHRGSGWRHGGAPTSAALVVTTIFFHYRVGCWCDATRRHALLPQHCRWPVRCCLGQFARR